MREELFYTAHDQFDKPVLPGQPITDFPGLRFTIATENKPTDPIKNGPADTPFDRLLREKERVGLHVPIRRVPGFRVLIAVPFQKILIVKLPQKGEKPSDLLRETRTPQIPLLFAPFGSKSTIQLLVRVVRVCEYENPPDEYQEEGNAVPTRTVLIEWSQPEGADRADTAFGFFVRGQMDILHASQTENLIIQDPPNNKPGPPIAAGIEDDPIPAGFAVENSDFEPDPPQGDPATADDPVVAVLDTGIKTRFQYSNGGITHTYPDSSLPTQMRAFKLASAPVQHPHGYTPITEYLRASSESDPALGLPAAADLDYWNIPTLTRLHTLSKAAILNSPFDDHLLTNKTERRGRHGTTLSAIINQMGGAAVLPVKVFNQGGFGTLYDLLCGLNYVLCCRRKGLPVHVVNLSFAGQMHYDSYQLLRSKFRALQRADIWAVAAAGNDHRELKTNVTDPDFDPSAHTTDQVVWNLFPACFAGDPELSVFTATTARLAYFRLVPKPPRQAGLAWPLTPEIQRAIFRAFKLPGNLKLVPVYKTTRNYGQSFVSVGVIEPITKVFQHADPQMNTTSFSTAYFSARLANYLHSNNTANRQQILDFLTKQSEMVSATEISDNRLTRYQ